MSLFKKPGQSLIHVDFPLKIPRSTVFTVQGWIAGDRPIETLYAGKRQLELVRRPDVEAAHPDKEYVLGFQGIAGYDAVHEGHLVLEFSENRNRQTYHHELSPSPMLELSMEEKFKKFRTLFPAESPERLMTESRELEIDPDEATREGLKKRKVEKVLGRLRCTGCMHSFEITDLPSDDLQCSVCNEHYQVRGSKIDFLNAHTREEFNIEATANVATRGHDPLALALIAKYRDGLILDCGAGHPFVEYQNVLNYEIVDYPTTDIIGAGEKLPFLDSSFDAVFSFSVLEHVKDPFQSAREITRVLKPGGTLYCSVPFLQPLHAYPHHYYNMTSAGLKNLFSDSIDIRESGVPVSGEPLFTLSWIIRSWSSSLQGQSKNEFLGLSLKDLMENAEKYVQASFVLDQPKSMKETLACTTMVLGNKINAQS